MDDDAAKAIEQQRDEAARMLREQIAAYGSLVISLKASHEWRLTLVAEQQRDALRVAHSILREWAGEGSAWPRVGNR